MPPKILTVITSKELDLGSGEWAQLDEAVGQFQREPLVLRTVSVLNTIAAGGAEGARNLSNSLASILPLDPQQRLLKSLEREGATFLEPWHQLVLLRRALTIRSTKASGALEFLTERGEGKYFDACRFAADVLDQEDPFAEGPAAADPDAWVKIAAHFMPRLWMSNPPDVGAWIARFDIMFRELPKKDQEVAKRVAALNERFPKAIAGLTFEQTATLVQFLGVWSIRLKPADIFADPSVVRLNPDTWLKDTDLPKDALQRLLKRAGRGIAEDLPDGAIKSTPLPFRDRPFLSFSDGTCAPVFPPFVLEKLTPDIFWWLKDLDEEQQVKWQDDWGYVAQAYLIDSLKRIASLGNCGFQPRIETSEGEIDAAMWVNGHVALFEITSGSLREAEGTSADWELVRDGLRRVFVENPKGKKGPYKEAILQRIRDVHLVIDAKLPQTGKAKQLQRIYPVMVAADRRVRTPGVVNFLQKELRARLSAESQARTADLAVLGLEDVEEAESLIQTRKELQVGLTRGFLQVARRWDVDRGLAPSWWQFIEAVYGGVPPNTLLQAGFKKWRDGLKDRFPVGAPPEGREVSNEKSIEAGL